MVFGRNQRIIAIIGICILLLAGIIYWYQKGTPTNPKPFSSPTPPANPESQKSSAAKDYKWYIKFSVKQQKSTAYTEAPAAQAAASGRDYYFGGVAVHPRYPLQSGGKATTPIIPFGTEIFLNKPINIQGEEKKSLVVTDTGDVNYGLWPEHPYWFDIYWGSTNYYNDKGAREYGSHLTDYYWYEPWK